MKKMELFSASMLVIFISDQVVDFNYFYCEDFYQDCSCIIFTDDICNGVQKHYEDDGVYN